MAVLRTPGQRVWLPVFRNGAIEDLEVDTGELLCPVRLQMVEDLGGGKVFQILVVRKHLHLVRSALKIPSPVFECDTGVVVQPECGENQR